MYRQAAVSGNDRAPKSEEHGFRSYLNGVTIMSDPKSEGTADCVGGADALPSPKRGAIPTPKEEIDRAKPYIPDVSDGEELEEDRRTDEFADRRQARP